MMRPGINEEAMLRYLRTFTSQKPKTVVRQVRGGHDLATQAVVLSKDRAFQSKLVKAGVVDAILERLQDPTVGFAQALSYLSPDADLSSPTPWINGLMNLCHPTVAGVEHIRMQIAKKMAPLVPVMVDCENKKLFGSTDYWLSGTMFFVGLVSNLFLSESVKDYVMQQDYADDLRQYLVRMLYLDLYGEDLKDQVLEAEGRLRAYPGTIGNIQNSAAYAVQELSDIPKNRRGTGLAEEGIPVLRELAETPVSPDLAGEGVTLSTELLNLAKNAREATLQGQGYNNILFVFQQFIFGLGHKCFGPGVSITEEIMKLCHDAKVVRSNPSNRCHTLEALYPCLLRPERYTSELQPSDAEVAMALENGVIEVGLEFMASREKDPRLPEAFRKLLSLVGDTSFQRKTNKALRKRSTSIRDELTELSRNGMPSPELSGLVRVVRAVLDKASLSDVDTRSFDMYPSKDICRRCQKTLAPEEVKRCSGCHRASYCSRECQVSDWKHGGHKQACKLMRTKDLQELESGGTKKEAKSARKLEKNLSMSGNVLFSKHIPQILLQASLRGYSILECVVLMDFTALSPTIKIISYDEFMEQAEPGSREYHLALFERNRMNGALTTACVANAGHGGCEVLIKTMPEANAPPPRIFAPAGLETVMGLMNTSSEPRWVVAQRFAELSINLEEIVSQPETRDQMIQDLMKTDSSFGQI